MLVFVAVVAAVAGFLFGFDEGVISGAQIFLRQDFHYGPAMEGVMTSAVPLGALVGAMLAGRLTAGLGRRKVLLAAAVLFALGALLSALTPSIEVLVLARLILGLAIGVAAIVAPLYLSETAPTHRRGVMVATYQLMVTIGILAAYLVDFALAHWEAWRWMFAAGVVPALVLMVGAWRLPESPRWLAAQGRVAEVKSVLALLRKDASQSDLATEAEQILETARDSHGAGHSWRHLFGATVRPAVIVAMGLFALQQLSGINAVIYYAPQIFAGTGFTGTGNQLMATIGIGVVNVVMTLVAMWLIDKTGRRKLLLVGFAGTAIGLAMLSYSADMAAAGASGGLPATLGFIGVVLFIASFAIALGPIPFIIMSEIYPMSVRGPGMAMASVANWGFNYIVVLLFPMALAGVGLSATFGFFAAICALGLIFTLALVPETKGISLEAIERYLYGGGRLSRLGKALDGSPGAASGGGAGGR